MNSTSISRLALSSACAALLAAACGGSSGIDLFSNVDAGPGGNGSEAGTASSSSGSSGATSSGGTPDAGVPEGGARPGGDTTAIPCGATACSLATDVCCVTNGSGQQGSNASFACLTAATCPRPGGPGSGEDNEGVTLKCTASANCAAGTVCCASRTENAVIARCAASCTDDQAQLCDPTAAVTGCSPSEPCSSEEIRDWRLPRTFATCGGKGN